MNMNSFKKFGHKWLMFNKAKGLLKKRKDMSTCLFTVL